MKFKKFFAVLSAVSMLASVSAVNANAEDELLTASAPYSFEYQLTADGAVVSYVSVSEGVDEVEIPEKTDAGITIVGVKDFAFKDANVATIVVPDTFKTYAIGDVAFLTAEDIADFIGEFGSSEKEALTYAANTVEFMGKNDWTGDEEELAAAGEVLSGILDTAGLTGSAQADNQEGITADQAAHLAARLYEADATGEKPYYVREDGVDDITKMSEKSYENLQAWVRTLPVNVTLKGTEGTAAEEYANGKAILGVNFEAKETHLIGDANQDGVVNVRDCAKIANALAFKTVDKLPCFTCADFNQDGEVTVRDAAQLAAQLAKLK